MSPTASKFGSLVHVTWTLLFSMLVLVIIAGELHAQYQNIGAFATRSSRGRTPLSVKYDLDIASGMQMGFVNVSVTDPSGPSKNDRNLVAVVYVKLWGSNSQSIAYRKSLQLPEGATTAQVEIPFSAMQAQISWDVAIYEDGRDIEDTRNKKSNPNQQDYHWSYLGNQPGTTFQIAGLQATTTASNVLAEEITAISEFTTAKLAESNKAAGIVGATPGVVLGTSGLTSVHKASDDWRHYFPFPGWVASADAIAEVQLTRPDAANALRTYLAAGGVVFVYDVKSQESLSKVEQFLNGTDSVNANAWRESVIVRRNELISVSSSAISTETQANTTPDLINKLLEGKRHLSREVGLGQIIVAQQSLPELLKLAGFADLFIASSKSRITLTSVAHDGSWYWQNLILEVGKPPVLAFCVMVTLFGGVLGPGLLYFTGRMQRRSLMIFLVPAVSLLATLAIVIYGVLHEGFATHVRVHSVTAYDASSQNAFSWSRQNYFSGLPPREGLQFPPDAFVRSVAPDDYQRYSGTPNPRNGVDGTVTFAEQQVWSNWLKPRQHQQLLVGHKVDPASLPIAIKQAAAGAIQVSNLTDSILPFVVLRGEADDYFIATDVAPEKTVELQPQDHDSVAIIVGRVGADFKPTMPPELVSGGDSLMNFGNSRRYTRTYAVQTDIINETYKQYLSDAIELPPFGFATLVPELSAIAIPIKGVQADNVNLVIGVKPW